jgi:hypothetical protein
MLTHKADKEVVILWDSITEPAEAAARITNEARRTEAAQFAAGTYTKSQDDAEWFGCSLPEFHQRITGGWAEGVDRVLALECKVREAATLAAKSVRRRRVREGQGDEVDMQSVWRGDISRAWTRTRRQSRVSTRVVSIICNVGGLSNVTAADLFWSGAAALRLANELTAAGYSVGLYAGQYSDNVDEARKVGGGQFVEIKAPDAPLDLSKLAAITCLAGYFRTAMFAGKVVAMDMAGRNVNPGLGYTNVDKVAAAAAKVGLTGCIVEPAIYSEAQAVAWVASQTERLEAAAA